MLDVGDVDVLNTLINKCSVESILLIEQRAEASHVIERQHVHGMLSVSGSLWQQPYISAGLIVSYI